MIYIDTKYIPEISSNLQLFKKRGEFLYNFRCPFCNDSQKKKNKARGYLYRSKNGNSISFKCHNCGLRYSFSSFLERIDINVFKKYSLEKFADSNNSILELDKSSYTSSNTAREKFSYTKIDLPSILDLPQKHWAKDYILNRKIPVQYLNKLFYADDFKKFISETFGQDKANNLINNEPRIVIPFYNIEKEIIAVQGRSLLKSKIRYITIKISDELKVFGLDRINPNSRVYIVEGPLDSLFLHNCLAAGGAELHNIINNYNDVVCVFDNEPWNKEIKKMMKDVIRKGKSIVIWPTYIKEKDINDMVINGIDVENVIRENTFRSLEAEAKMMFWCRGQ